MSIIAAVLAGVTLVSHRGHTETLHLATQAATKVTEASDKWNEYPQRRTMFRSWLNEITTMLDDLGALQGKGVPAVAARLSESFTPEVIERSVKGYGQYLREQRETGRLRMTSAGLLTTTAVAGPKVRGHTFHGD